MYKEMLEKLKKLSEEIDNCEGRRAKNKLIVEFRNTYLNQGFEFYGKIIAKKISDKEYLKLDEKNLTITKEMI